VRLNYLLKVLLLTIGILSGTAGLLSAQDEKQAAVKVSGDEAKAVKKIEGAKTLADKIKATDEFLKKYPKSPVRDQAAGYLAGQIMQLKDDAQVVQNGETYLTMFTEPAEADLILPSLIYSYSAVKRHPEAFAAAEKYFSRHPENVSLRLKMAIDGSNLRRGGTKDFTVPSRNYAAQAIALIEANKKPADIDDAGWKEYQTKWLAQLYQSVGVIDFYAGDKTNARANFEKAIKIDAADINSWVLLSNMIDEEYQDLAMKYNVADPGAARDELLKQANEKMDQVIDMFARIVALTDARPEARPINEQVRQNLEGYYKYRHKNLDGLPALINKYKK
jgi:tetratricopeptide (TPR) repeat protein